MDYPKAQYACNLAARFWFHKNNIKIETIANYWEISVDEVRDILDSEEYLSAVETLIRTTQSPGNVLKWIESSPYAEPSKFAERMELTETAASEMIEKIKQDIRTQ